MLELDGSPEPNDVLSDSGEEYIEKGSVVADNNYALFYVSELY
jgi:hypothetical protein